MIRTDYSHLNINRDIDASDASELETILGGLSTAITSNPELTGYATMLDNYLSQLDKAVETGNIDIQLLKDIEQFANSALGSSLIKKEPSLQAAFDQLKKEANEVYGDLLYQGGSSSLREDLYGKDPTKFSQALEVMFFMLDRTDVLYEINQQKMDSLKALQDEMDEVNKLLGNARANEHKSDKDAKNVEQEMLDMLDKYDARPDGMKTKDLKDQHWQIVIKSFEQLQQQLMNDSQQLMTEMKLSQDDVKVAFDTAKNFLQTDYQTIKDIISR